MTDYKFIASEIVRSMTNYELNNHQKVVLQTNAQEIMASKLTNPKLKEYTMYASDDTLKKVINNIPEGRDGCYIQNEGNTFYKHKITVLVEDNFKPLTFEFIKMNCIPSKTLFNVKGNDRMLYIGFDSKNRLIVELDFAHDNMLYRFEEKIIQEQRWYL